MAQYIKRLGREVGDRGMVSILDRGRDFPLLHSVQTASRANLLSGSDFLGKEAIGASRLYLLPR
jgi:hypothetical protein